MHVGNLNRNQGTRQDRNTRKPIEGYVLLVGGKHETVFHEMDILKEIRYFQERKLLKPKFPNPLMVVEAREALRWPTPGSPALFGGAGPIKKVDPGKKEETTTLYLLDGITTCFLEEVVSIISSLRLCKFYMT